MSEPHSITAGYLKCLLTQLRDSDVLIPNEVANLKIERDGKYIGFVDLLENNQHVEFFDESEGE